MSVMRLRHSHVGKIPLRLTYGTSTVQAQFDRNLAVIPLCVTVSVAYMRTELR
jgi:hypothetical protein